MTLSVPCSKGLVQGGGVPLGGRCLPCHAGCMPRLRGKCQHEVRVRSPPVPRSSHLSGRTAGLAPHPHTLPPCFLRDPSIGWGPCTAPCSPSARPRSEQLGFSPDCNLLAESTGLREVKLALPNSILQWGGDTQGGRQSSF